MKVANGMPELMNKDAKPGNAGGLYFVLDGTGVPFDSTKFKAGDDVASYVIYPLKGDRADIQVAVSWRNGMHSSVISMCNTRSGSLPSTTPRSATPCISTRSI